MLLMNLTELPLWQTLATHQQDIANQHMRDWFANDPDRTSKFSLSMQGMLLDYSVTGLMRKHCRFCVSWRKCGDLSKKSKRYLLASL